MKEKCHDCEKTQGEESWLSCPSCRTTLCQNCQQKREEKERRELETLRTGDPHSRLQVLCPSCQTHMNLL